MLENARNALKTNYFEKVLEKKLFFVSSVLFRFFDTFMVTIIRTFSILSIIIAGVVYNLCLSLPYGVRGRVDPEG